MKRSEFIQKIANITEDKYFPITHDDVNEVIKIAEQFGMLPPVDDKESVWHWIAKITSKWDEE